MICQIIDGVGFDVCLKFNVTGRYFVFFDQKIFLIFMTLPEKDNTLPNISGRKLWVRFPRDITM